MKHNAKISGDQVSAKENTIKSKNQFISDTLQQEVSIFGSVACAGERPIPYICFFFFVLIFISLFVCLYM